LKPKEEVPGAQVSDNMAAPQQQTMDPSNKVAPEGASADLSAIFGPKSGMLVKQSPKGCIQECCGCEAVKRRFTVPLSELMQLVRVFGIAVPTVGLPAATVVSQLAVGVARRINTLGKKELHSMSRLAAELLNLNCNESMSYEELLGCCHMLSESTAWATESWGGTASPTLISCDQGTVSPTMISCDQGVPCYAYQPGQAAPPRAHQQSELPPSQPAFGYAEMVPPLEQPVVTKIAKPLEEPIMIAKPLEEQSTASEDERSADTASDDDESLARMDSRISQDCNACSANKSTSSIFSPVLIASQEKPTWMVCKVKNTFLEFPVSQLCFEGPSLRRSSSCDL